jgi:DNA-binding transcriptional regulator YiaG
MDAAAIRDWMRRSPLRIARQKRGLTQREVAAAVGVSATAVQNWEWGSSYPSDFSLRLLSELLGDPDLSRRWAEWWSAERGRGNVPARSKAEGGAM